MQRLITAIKSEPWAITAPALRTILDIAERKNDVEAVEAKLGSPLENTRTVTTRGKTAVIPVIGSIIRYGNMFSRVSGATSLDILSLDFQSALDNPEIDTILLQLDTPGGQAAGISEFADRIKASNKKVIAYIDSQCASAGYWIASACDEIIANKMAMIGSLGVVFAMQDTSEADAKNGIKNIEIVSNVSPKKRPDITSKEGQSQIQKWADSLGSLFIEAVADFRGVSVETVLAKFGQGDMFLAEEALNVGMIDRLGDFETLIEEIQSNSAAKSTKNLLIGESMTLEEFRAEHPQLHEQIVNDAYAEGVVAERERIQAIDSINVTGYEEMVRTMKFDGKSTALEVKSALFDVNQEKLSKVKANVLADAEDLAAQAGEIPNEESNEETKADKAANLLSAAVKKINGEA